MLIMIKTTITPNTIKTNLLNLHAPAGSPCSNLDIARVKPQAGHSQCSKMPDVGQLPLKINGRM